MSVHADPSADVWILNDLPDAVSQFRTTVSMVSVAPRSTCSHWGSLKALDQRVPVLPSVAFEAAEPAFSVEEAVVGLPWDSRAPWADAAVGAEATTSPVRTVVAAAANASSLVRRRGRARSEERAWATPCPAASSR